MPGNYDFTLDNIGAGDTYIVTGDCKRIRMFEKDRSAATLAAFNVYIPVKSGGTPIQYQGGEEFRIESPSRYVPGQRPFQAETVSVASRVFSVIEEA